MAIVISSSSSRIRIRVSNIRNSIRIRTISCRVRRCSIRNGSGFVVAVFVIVLLVVCVVFVLFVCVVAPLPLPLQSNYQEDHRCWQ